MSDYTRGHFVCSCGRVLTRSSFRKHRHANPTHFEIDRYTYDKTPDSTHGKIREVKF